MTRSLGGEQSLKAEVFELGDGSQLGHCTIKGRNAANRVYGKAPYSRQIGSALTRHREVLQPRVEWPMCLCLPGRSREAGHLENIGRAAQQQWQDGAYGLYYPALLVRPRSPLCWPSCLIEVCTDPGEPKTS